MKKLAWLFLLFTVALLGTDFTGKWTGAYTYTGPDGDAAEGHVVLTLQQKDSDLTGTAVPDDGDALGIKGTVDGDTVTFDVDGMPPLHFVLKFDDGHLKGEGKGEADGKVAKGTVDLVRKAE